MARIAISPPRVLPPPTGLTGGFGSASSTPAPSPAELGTPVIGGPSPIPFIPPPAPEGTVGRVTDADILEAIRSALFATGLYDDVIVARPNDFTPSGIESRTVLLDVMDDALAYYWDAPSLSAVLIDTRLRLTFICRCDDPELRDKRLKIMCNSAYNTMQGRSWLGATFPAFTGFVQHTKWFLPNPPDRQAEAIYTYRYEPGEQFDVSEN